MNAHLPSTRGLPMRFCTIGNQLIGLGEQERGLTKSRPTRPMGPNNRAHIPQSIIDKSCKIGNSRYSLGRDLTIADTDLSCKLYPLGI
jgi:hypothetical protein